MKIEELPPFTRTLQDIEQSTKTRIGHNSHCKESDIFCYGFIQSYESDIGPGEVALFKTIIKDKVDFEISFSTHAELLAFCEKHNYPVYNNNLPIEKS